MSTLRDALSNAGRTENGAVSFKSSGSYVVDFFAHAGALRTGGNVTDVIRQFARAYDESPVDAVLAAFYLRDVRGGQGEREAFRLILLWLADNHPDTFAAIMHHIPEYGRWDDLVNMGPHKNVTQYIVSFVNKQLRADIIAATLQKPVSLLGKWMPSENASSPATKDLAWFWMEKLGYVRRINGKQFGMHMYRKRLSLIRKQINIVERHMSANRWEDIDFGHVTSRSMFILRKAFAKHQPERWAAYIEAVKAGAKKINAATLFPYEIIEKIHGDDDTTLPLMWNALPDFFVNQGAKKVMVVCDTSGSMSGRPMEVAISLTLYAAERMTGAFADTAITFSAEPEFITINRNRSLGERDRILRRANSGLNTNFQAVFTLLLDTAVRMGVKQGDMPDVLFCISDMQFDQADGSALSPYYRNAEIRQPTNFEAIKAMYAAAGYEMPLFVMWNVRANGSDESPVMQKEEGVFLVSGCSPIIFKQALALDTRTISPYEAMMQTLQTERLAPVQQSMQQHMQTR